jgi:cellobiose-specific phosphotransferase system component IIC
MFASDYHLSTWQDGLKIYAPAIMIGSIIVFIIYAILAFFTKGSVPVPAIPSIMSPGENSVTNTVVKSLNKIANTANDMIKSTNNTNNTNNTNKNKNDNGNNNENKNNNSNNSNKNKHNQSRSFLETI